MDYLVVSTNGTRAAYPMEGVKWINKKAFSLGGKFMDFIEPEIMGICSSELTVAMFLRGDELFDADGDLEFPLISWIEEPVFE